MIYTNRYTVTKVILIAHNLRSCHNVGSLLRTADGFGVEQVILSGYTPYPHIPTNDPRMPHLAAKIDKQIHKTALGAEHTVQWQHTGNLLATLRVLRQEGWHIAALEQSPDSISLPDFVPPDKLALIAGREVEGVESEVLQACDIILEIPMSGTKESFNVASSCAIALYHCRFPSRPS